MTPERTTRDTTTQQLSGLRLWTQCEYHLLQQLTSGPYLLTKKQITQSMITGSFPARVIRKALRRLQEQGWLQQHGLRTCLAPLPSHPLMVCEPGSGDLDLRSLKTIAQRRDRESRIWQSRIVWLPSRQASGLFGSPCYGLGSTQTQALHVALSERVARNDNGPSPTGHTWLWDQRPTFRPYERVIGIRRTMSDGTIQVTGVVGAQSLKSLQQLHSAAAVQDWTLELW